MADFSMRDLVGWQTKVIIELIKTADGTGFHIAEGDMLEDLPQGVYRLVNIQVQVAR